MPDESVYERLKRRKLVQWALAYLAGAFVVFQGVEVLADLGIHKICGQEYWEDQVRQMIRGLKSGKGCEAVCEAIRQIGGKLANNFPPRPDDTDELSNSVRFGHQSLERPEPDTLA